MLEVAEQEKLLDTVALLTKEDHRAEAKVVIKASIEQTFHSLNHPTDILRDMEFDVPSSEVLDRIRVFTRHIYQHLQLRDYKAANKFFIEYLELLSQLANKQDPKELLSTLLAYHALGKLQGSVHESMGTYRVEQKEYYSTLEVAKKLGLSDQTIRRHCEKGVYKGAYQTDGGHWRIPARLFKTTLEQDRKAEEFLEYLDRKSAITEEMNKLIFEDEGVLRQLSQAKADRDAGISTYSDDEEEFARLVKEVGGND